MTRGDLQPVSIVPSPSVWEGRRSARITASVLNNRNDAMMFEPSFQSLVNWNGGIRFRF